MVEDSKKIVDTVPEGLLKDKGDKGPKSDPIPHAPKGKGDKGPNSEPITPNVPNVKKAGGREI